MKDAETEARWRDQQLVENGLLDEGESTETAHNDYIKEMRKPFTGIERQMLRYSAGLFPPQPKPPKED